MPDKLPGIVIDDEQATRQGKWISSSANGGYVGTGYRHDGDQRNGESIARFETKIPKAGKYEVRLSYPSNNNRSSKVRVEIVYAEGSKGSATMPRIFLIAGIQEPMLRCIQFQLPLYGMNGMPRMTYCPTCSIATTAT